MEHFVSVEPTVKRTWVDKIILVPIITCVNGTSQTWRFQLNLYSEMREMIMKAVVGNLVHTVRMCILQRRGQYLRMMQVSASHPIQNS